MRQSVRMTQHDSPLRRWHDVVAAQDASLLDQLLADDVVFRSPAIHAPQRGKVLATGYLTAALAVLGPTLRYVDEWSGDHSSVLEFEAEVGGRTVHGVDMLRWNDDGRLTSFTVMVRPFSGLQQLMAAMVAELDRIGATHP
jgi:SnoaL-like protein